jgi:hypothetical protein
VHVRRNRDQKRGTNSNRQEQEQRLARHSGLVLVFVITGVELVLSFGFSRARKLTTQRRAIAGPSTRPGHQDSPGPPARASGPLPRWCMGGTSAMSWTRAGRLLLSAEARATKLCRIFTPSA